MPGFAKSMDRRGQKQTAGLLPAAIRQPVRSGPQSEILELQRSIGNQAVGQLLQSDTAYSSSSSGVLQRKCASRPASGGQCAEFGKNQPALQRASLSASGREIGSERKIPPIVHEVVRSPGQPIDSAVRAFMEPRFGRDLSGIRVHTDAKAAESAQVVNAQAYTVGRDVVFGSGQYIPGTSAGRHLLAHELAHVEQQGDTTANNGRVNKVDATSGPLERHADLVADRVAGLPSGRAGVASRAHAQAISPPLTLGLRLQKKEAEKSAAPVTKVIGDGAFEDAVKLAGERMNEIIGGLAAPATGGLKGATIELHVIPHDKKLTDLAEFKHLKGVKTHDGRIYDVLRGVGGIKSGDTIRYAIAEEQLVSISGKPSEYARGFVAAHETGHIVEQYGLTDEQKKQLQAAYNKRKKAGGPWLNPAKYTSSRPDEYFAQSSSAYFRHPYSDSAEDKKTYTPEWLEKNDPDILSLLKTIYVIPQKGKKARLPIHPRTDFTEQMIRDVENL